MKNRELQSTTSLLFGYRFSLLLTVAALLLPLSAWAQNPALSSLPSKPDSARPAREKNPKRSSELWLERAQELTTEPIAEQRWINSWQIPILKGRLGQAWFQADPIRAQRWLERAVEAVEKASPDETAPDKTERAEAAHVLLKIVMPLDQRLADRLLKILSASPLGQVPSCDAPQSTDRAKLAQDLSEAAQSVVNGDPARAAQLAKLFLALRGGNDIQNLIGGLQLRGGSHINGLYNSLRQADRQVADQVFLQAVASARSDYDYTILFALSEIAFPTVSDPSAMPLSPQLRSAFLEVVAEGMLRVPRSESERAQICQLSSLAGRLLGAFPPAQLGAVESAIQSCQGDQEGGDDDNLQDAVHQCSDSADYLYAATNEANLKRRCHLKSQAAFMALQGERDPASALAIWDGFTPEEREAYPTWPVDRNAAAEAAIANLYHVQDLTGMSAVILRTPDAQRPKLQLSAAAMLFSRNDKPLGIWMLTEARRTLERVDVDDVNVYLMLLTTYAAAMPSEVPEIFKLTVAGLNRIPPPKPDSRLWVFPAGYDLRPYQFGRSMSELDAGIVNASIQALDSPVQRVSFRLGFLQSMLDRHNAKNQKNPHSTRLAKVEISR